MAQKEKSAYPTLAVPKSGIFLIISGLILLNTSIVCGKSAQAHEGASSRTLRAMARVYMARGDYSKAAPLAEKALAVASTKDDDIELSLCLIDLGYLYKSAGRAGDAEKMCVQGLRLQERLYGQEHPYVAYTLRVLSSIYLAQGRYQEAESALERAMKIILTYHSDTEQQVAPFLVDKAKLLASKGDLAKAESYYQEAIGLIMTSYGPGHLYTAEVLGDAAKAYMLQGRYVKAEGLINQAEAIQEGVYGKRHRLLAATWLTKAEICLARGDGNEAEKLIQKALAVMNKSKGPAAITGLQQHVEKIRSQKNGYSLNAK